MVPIRKSVIVCILILNIVGILINIFIIINGYDLRILEEEPQISYKQYNLRGSKLKINGNNFFGISKINENIFKKNIRLLSKLSLGNYKLLIEILNGFCVYLFIILMISFCISDKPTELHFDFNILSILGEIENPIQILMIPFILALYLVFYLVIYMLTCGVAGLLGKKNSQYCSLILVLIVETGMSIVCFILENKGDAFIVLGSIYSVLAVFNFLTILIPNLSCEEQLRSQDLQVSNNQNPNFIMNNNSDNYNNNFDSSNMQYYLNTIH